MSVEHLAQLLGLPHTNAYRCNGCDEVINPGDYEIGPLYECGECGTMFTREGSADGASHRCPDCNKFAARSAEMGCPECNEADLFEITVVVCPWCDKAIPDEDFDSHISCEG